MCIRDSMSALGGKEWRSGTYNHKIVWGQIVKVLNVKPRTSYLILYLPLMLLLAVFELENRCQGMFLNQQWSWHLKKINPHQWENWFGREVQWQNFLVWSNIGQWDWKGKKQIWDIMKEDMILLKTRLKICFHDVLFFSHMVTLIEMYHQYARTNVPIELTGCHHVGFSWI